MKNKYKYKLPEPGDPVTVSFVVKLPGGAQRTSTLPMNCLHVTGGDDPRMMLRFKPGVKVSKEGDPDAG